jgi:dihydroorotase-like cyclic amidohydrolase
MGFVVIINSLILLVLFVKVFLTEEDDSDLVQRVRDLEEDVINVSHFILTVEQKTIKALENSRQYSLELEHRLSLIESYLKEKNV